MNKIVSVVTLAALVVLGAGCASLEHNSYVAIGATTTAVELARQSYIQHVNDCQCVHESEIAKVEGYYEKYQLMAKIAQDTITAYKNSTDPNQSALTVAIDGMASSASDIVTLIESLLPPAETAQLKTKIPKESKAK